MEFEQYIHTLIAANSNYRPEPLQVAEFMNSLVEKNGFDTASATASRRGIRVVKPSGNMRSYTSALTGETLQSPEFDVVTLSSCREFATALVGLEHYNAIGSGEWTSGLEPIKLFTTDEQPYTETYYTDVVCSFRPEAVSTSCVSYEVPYANEVTPFGEVSNAVTDVGVFSNPWNDERIDVPGAGRARFWIGFEFGKFLVPKIGDSFELMAPAIVREAEDCFRTKFAQGWYCY
jgi:hypothetical protein